MQKIIITVFKVLSYLLMFFGLLFGIVGFIRSFSFNGEEYLLVAYYGLTVFMSGAVLYVISYVLKAACLYIDNNEKKENEH